MASIAAASDSQCSVSGPTITPAERAVPACSQELAFEDGLVQRDCTDLSVLGESSVCMPLRLLSSARLQPFTTQASGPQ